MNERSSDDPVTPRRPRGRPRRFDAEAGVAAARELFAARGYDGVGVAELCAALGITPTSLYAAWGSKAGLHAACVAGYAAETAAAFAAALARAASPAEVRPCLLAAAAAGLCRGGPWLHGPRRDAPRVRSRRPRGTARPCGGHGGRDHGAADDPRAPGRRRGVRGGGDDRADARPRLGGSRGCCARSPPRRGGGQRWSFSGSVRASRRKSAMNGFARSSSRVAA